MFKFKNEYQKELLLGGKPEISNFVKSFVPNDEDTMFKCNKTT